MDIVEKLRATEMRETGWELGGIPITKLTRINPDGPEAADEIERLREALRQAQCNCEEPCLHGQWCSSWIALNALKEKE